MSRTARGGLLGNDVVDLGDPETRRDTLHPRFDERVFCAAERAAVEASRAPHVTRWMLWAAKESAYKASKRLDPGLIFSPREFQVQLAAPAAGTPELNRGSVIRRGSVLDVEIERDGACVHAVATQGEWERVLLGVAEAVHDPSAAVRQLAIVAIGTALGIPPRELRIVGQPPVVMHHDRPVEATLSLSHHGHFVAFACALRR